ncbi:MAG: phosphoglycerate kinase [Alphaproteobacteria bacterium]|nr:phosphoglycerate kinase [Alphaproteobacteria bacterium]
MKLKTLNQIHNLQGKRVILRVDLNIPLLQGIIQDDTRIQAILPTLSYLKENKARVIIISHLGRPKNRKDLDFSLAPVAQAMNIPLVKDLDDTKTLQNGECCLFENIRFFPEEEQNDPQFSQKIAQYGDVFVNDAFSVCHREHASTRGITHFLPSYAGFHLQKEIDILDRLLTDPPRPCVAILGGAKISTKINLIKSLLDRVDTLLIGGALAHNFLKAQGLEIGASLYESTEIQHARNLLVNTDKIILPQDVKVQSSINRLTDNISKEDVVLDIGEQTTLTFLKAIQSAKSIIWNGPLGYTENIAFRKGTHAIAKAISEVDCLSVIGGADTISSLNDTPYLSQFSHVSTGGGAFLKYLENHMLPAILPLMEETHV